MGHERISCDLARYVARFSQPYVARSAAEAAAAIMSGYRIMSGSRSSYGPLLLDGHGRRGATA